MATIKLSEELKKQVRDAYDKYSEKEIEKALTEAGNFLIAKLKEVSPSSSGPGPHFKDMWVMKTQYKGVRYVGNQKTVKYKNRDIPLSNILESGINSKHKGFIRKTYRKYATQIEEVFIKSLK